MAGLNANAVFANGIAKLSTGVVDFDTDTIRTCIMRKSFANTTLTATAVDTYDFFNDIPAGDRAKTAAYPTLTTNDVVIQTTDNHVNYGGGTVTIQYTSVTTGLNCRGIVVFSSSTTTTVSPVICYCHFTTHVTSDGGAITVTLDADGVLQCSY